MAHYGTLKSFRFADAEEDVRGAEVYGRGDEKLGDIDDIIVDHSSGEIRYAVVDTGGWLSSRKFVVPAERIRRHPRSEDAFSVNLSKREVERFPAYDEKMLESDERWRDYEDRYRAELTTSGDVLHREGSDRTITAPAEQIGGGGGISSRGLAPQRLREGDTVGVTASGKPDVERGTLHPTATSPQLEIGRRWQAFSERVRQSREQIVAECPTCGERRVA